MTEETFKKQIGRLASQWANTYSQDRVSLILREFRHMPDEWLVKSVDRFLGESRAAPLLPDFRESASKYRDRAYLNEKGASTRDARDFWESKDQPEDVAFKMGVIKRRLVGKCNDTEWLSFMELIQNVARSA